MYEFKTNYGSIATSILVVFISIIVKLFTSFKDLTDERNSLQDRISRLEKDGRDRKSERNVSSYNNFAYHFDGDMTANRNRSTINTTNDQSQVTITNLKIEINELKENCQKMTFERLDLTNGIKKLRKEKIDLIYTNETLESTNKMLGNHFNSVKDENIDLKTKLKDIIEIDESFQNENTNLKKEIISMEISFKSLKEVNLYLKRGFADMKRNEEHSSQQFNQTVEKLKAMTSACESLKAENTDLHKKLFPELNQTKELLEVELSTCTFLKNENFLLQKDRSELAQKANELQFDNKNPERQFIEGVKTNNSELIVLALHNGADVNTVIPGQAPALVFASYHGNLNIVEILVKYGADVNITSSNKRCTALYYACNGGYSDIVQFLLRSNADINISNSRRWTSLHIAVRQNKIDIVKVLLQNGAKTYLSTKDGDTAHSLAVKNDCTQIRRLLESSI